MKRLVGEAIVLAVGATAWSVAWVIVGGASAVIEGVTMAARVRHLREQIDELEGRVAVVYAEHESSVDAELEGILGEG